MAGLEVASTEIESDRQLLNCRNLECFKSKNKKRYSTSFPLWIRNPYESFQTRTKTKESDHQSGIQVPILAGSHKKSFLITGIKIIRVPNDLRRFHESVMRACLNDKDKLCTALEFPDHVMRQKKELCQHIINDATILATGQNTNWPWQCTILLGVHKGTDKSSTKPISWGRDQER